MAGIDADDAPVGGWESAVKLELLPCALILAIGHHQTPQDVYSWTYRKLYQKRWVTKVKI